MGVELAVCALEIGVRDDAGASVAGAGDVDRVQVAPADRPVHVHVDQVQARGRAPVAEQPRLHVLRVERLPQERVVEQVDLPDREVVGGPPVGVDQPKLLVGEGLWHGCLLLSPWRPAQEARACSNTSAHRR